MVKVPDNVLTIDLDYRLNKEEMDIFIKTRKVILATLGYDVKDVIKHLSSSKRGHHIFIHLNKNIKNPNRKNFIELLCGSDKTRWLINKTRIKRGVKNWEKIFSKTIWQRPPKEPCKSCKLLRYMRQFAKENYE